MTFAYDTAEHPPAPSVEFEVVSLLDPAERHPARGLLDTGADISVLPTEMLTALRIPKAREIPVGSWDGSLTSVATYIVSLEIADGYLDSVEVVAGPISYAILGRDVLNHFILTLNGKDLTFELRDP